jgi:hypothetical protein
MRNPSSLMRIKLYDEVNGIRRDGLTYVEINTEKNNHYIYITAGVNINFHNKLATPLRESRDASKTTL